MSKKIVILGAGFGGLESAISLRRNLPASYHIILIDKKDHFLFGFTKFDVMFRKRSAEKVKLFYKNLSVEGINFIQDTITFIDSENRIVKTASSEFSFDYLIIALGADLKPEAISGFKEAGYEFYSLEGASKLSEVINNFNSGKIFISVFSKPYKCPPAPYEAGFLLHDFYTNKGIRNKIKISITIPGPKPIPLSSVVSEGIQTMLSERDINLLKNQKVIEIDSSAKQIITEDGGGIDFDLFIGVPVHIPPKVITDSSLGNPWIKVDKNNLETDFENIYAVGDVTSIPLGTLEVPKAGTLAEDGAKVIVNDILFKEKISADKKNYTASGSCYFETGSGKAAQIKADFLGNSEPQIILGAPSTNFKMDKDNYEKEHRKRWFKQEV